MVSPSFRVGCPRMPAATTPTAPQVAHTSSLSPAISQSRDRQASVDMQSSCETHLPIATLSRYGSHARWLAGRCRRHPRLVGDRLSRRHSSAPSYIKPLLRLARMLAHLTGIALCQCRLSHLRSLGGCSKTRHPEMPKSRTLCTARTPSHAPPPSYPSRGHRIHPATHVCATSPLVTLTFPRNYPRLRVHFSVRKAVLRRSNLAWSPRFFVQTFQNDSARPP